MSTVKEARSRNEGLTTQEEGLTERKLNTSPYMHASHKMTISTAERYIKSYNCVSVVTFCGNKNMNISLHLGGLHWDKGSDLLEFNRADRSVGSVHWRYFCPCRESSLRVVTGWTHLSRKPAETTVLLTQTLCLMPRLIKTTRCLFLTSLYNRSQFRLKVWFSRHLFHNFITEHGGVGWTFNGETMMTYLLYILFQPLWFLPWDNHHPSS